MPLASALDTILDSFGLTPDQRAAAAERRRSVTVTAGAGSGKTRTLVARYLGLLCEGWRPGQVVAITFTEKAAREMRTRARKELRRMLLAAQSPAERQAWAELDAQMDGARIGTIHSLCAEILRAHPAEAGIDPRFGVVDQNEAVRLRAAAVESALLWAVEQPELRTPQGQPLFLMFSVSRLAQLFQLLLEKRLEAPPESLDPAAGRAAVLAALRSFLRFEPVQAAMADFENRRQQGSLVEDAGDKLADQIQRLQGCFEQAAQALERGDATVCAQYLWQARRSEMMLNVGKRTSLAKEQLRALRECFDAQLEPWLGGKEPPDAQLEEGLASLAVLLQHVFSRVLANYRASLSERQSLDFDDLESGALELLRQPAVAARWQAEIAAVLVDEFQDTNLRQRQIVEVLCGAPDGRLFVVGDARQSIYRFRGADVSVFTSLQRDVQRGGGLLIDLDRTFRAHPGLLDGSGSLLAVVMGDQPDPLRPFHVPFAPLFSQREAPLEGVQPPYLECVMGAGGDAAAARQAAAHALAARLKELRAAGEIASWDSVALLFRASSGFPYYEEAFESAGIPYVTVAGSGFYERPEVRDVLNLLRALADPWDDQAMAGFLRSPAVGLSDPGLYRLRYQQGSYRPLRQALERSLTADDDETALPAADRPAAQRALDILREFEPWVDRLPVAELLRRLIARTDYRTILAASPSRLWRNIDKLLHDAQYSGLVRVRAFLEWVDALRDVGAREGEAAAAAAAGGAVRLMTIHKSKGLEFPVVVLADASRQITGGSALAYRIPAPSGGPGCWTFAPDRVLAGPLAYRLSKFNDARQSESESGRLLYVAMTRAMEKLIVSGHLVVKEDGSGVRAGGWMKELLEAGDADLSRCLAEQGTPFQAPLASGTWRLWLAAAQESLPAVPAAAVSFTAEEAAPLEQMPSQLPLVMPLIEPAPEPIRQSEHSEPASPQAHSTDPAIPMASATPVAPTPVAPAIIIGGMVHEALRRWRFDTPGAALDDLLRLHARQQRVAEGEALEEALRVAKILIARFQRHPLWSEVQAAGERYHAVACHTGLQRGAETIDVLYRTGGTWTLIDFHTGLLKDPPARQAALEKRLPALRARRQIVAARTGSPPRVLACFLDVAHKVEVVEIGD